MNKIPIVIDNFNNGMVSDEIQGRVTADWYLNSLKKCDNGVITKYGDVRRRPGTLYINEINADISSVESYKQMIFRQSGGDIVLLFVSFVDTTVKPKIYFYKNDGIVLDSTGTAIYSIDVDIPSSIKDFVQKDDVIYFTTEGSDALGKLTHMSDNDWVYEQISFDIKYMIGYGNGIASRAEGYLPLQLLKNNQITIKYTIYGTEYTATSDVNTISGQSSISGTSMNGSYVDYDTGRILIKSETDTVATYYYWSSGSSVSVGKIIQASNGSLFKATVGGTTGTAEPNWDVAYGATVTDNSVTWTALSVPFTSGTPIYVTFGDDDILNGKTLTMNGNRLVIGNIGAGSQVFVGSNVGSYETFVFGQNAGDAFIFEIASDYRDDILWMKSKNGILIGTPSSVYLAYGSSTSGITPTNIRISKQTEFGCADIPPIFVGSDLVYTSNNSKKIYKLSYNWNSQSYVANDLNLLNNEVLNAGVKRLEYEGEPYSRIWCLLNDKSIAISTFYPSESVLGWQTYHTNGNILDICSAENVVTDNVYDKMYMVVNRQDNKMVMETSQNHFYNKALDSIFLDGAVKYSLTTATDTFAVPYDDGTELDVLTDKGVHPTVTVSNGNVVLSWTANTVVIGYKYTMNMETVDIELSQEGQMVSLNEQKTIKSVCANLLKSLGGQAFVGNEYELFFRTPLDLMGYMPSLYTGCKKIQSVTTNNVITTTIGIYHDDPLPFIVRGFRFDLMVGA